MFNLDSLQEFFRSDRRVSVGKLNALVQAVQQLSAKVNAADPGASMARVLINSGKTGEFIAWCRIAAVNVGTPNPNSISGRPAYTPSTVTYDVIGIDNAGIDLSAATPHYGRPTRYDDALIHPARVTDLCYVEWGIDSSGDPYSRLGLLPGCEVVARKVCSTSESGGGGGGLPEGSIIFGGDALSDAV